MAEQKSTKEALTVTGVPGLSVWSGIIKEEYLSQLSRSDRYKVFREMQDDAVIGGLLDSMKMPLIAAEFTVDPKGEEEVNKKAAEFLEQCMGDMTKYSWRQHVLDALGTLDYGWSVSDMSFKKRLWQDGERPSKYNDGKMGIHILDPRGQETLYNWEFDDEYNVELMRQRDPVSGDIIEIPAWKMLHVTFRSRKRNPEGTSPLRSLYRAWYTRRNLEIIEAIGAERDLAGLPCVTLPHGATSADKAAAEEIVRKVRQDEESGIVLPPPPMGEGAGWDFKLLTGGSKAYDTRKIINDLNKVMLMRFFAQFLLLGMEKAGTQALVKGSHDFFSLALRSIQQELMEAWNDQLVPLLFKFNPMPGLEQLPEIDWAMPGKQDITGMASFIKELTGVNVITPSHELEDFMRAVGGLPERPEGLGEGPRSGVPLSPPGAPEFAYRYFLMPDGSWVVSQSPKSVHTVSAKYQLTPQDWQDAYNKGTPHWAMDLSPSLFAQEFVEEMKAKKLASVLEIGCGNGRDAILFAKAGFNVTAIDVVPKAIDLAKQNALEAEVNIDFQVVNAEALPFDDNQFDAVFTLSVLHSTDLKKSIAEAARVLRGNGLMFLYVYSDTEHADGKKEIVISMANLIALLMENKLTMLDIYSEQEEAFDEFGEKHKVIVALVQKGS